jgi:hypothetical protein
MYAACAWIVQMLLAVSKRGTIFSYVPEVYVESLVSRQMHFGPFPCCAVDVWNSCTCSRWKDWMTCLAVGNLGMVFPSKVKDNLCNSEVSSMNAVATGLVDFLTI